MKLSLNVFSKIILFLCLGVIVVGCSNDSLKEEQANSIDPYKIDNAENSQAIQKTNYIELALSEINKNYEVRIEQDNLILDSNENFENQEIKILVFSLKETKYTVAFSLKTTKLIALNSQYTKNKGEKTEVTYVNIAGNGKEYNFNYSSNLISARSCAGQHYLKMMEVIESDGDLSFLCEWTSCSVAVYAAAVAHCAIRH